MPDLIGHLMIQRLPVRPAMTTKTGKRLPVKPAMTITAMTIRNFNM